MKSHNAVQVHVLAITLLVATLNCLPLHAASLPIWGPAMLTRHSDLIIIGDREFGTRVAVRKVLKGRLPTKSIIVADLARFGTTVEIAPTVFDDTVAASEEVIVFLDLRQPSPRVVANGVFRTGSVQGRGGALGYWQPINPGGYVLKREIAFDSLEAIERAVKAELADIPRRQSNIFARAKSAKTTGEFGRHLNDLADISRFGDMTMLRAVTSLEVDGAIRRPHHLYSFVQDVKDPQAHKLLEQMYFDTREVRILYAIGHLGHPASLGFFESIIREGKVTKPSFALWGMKVLYLTCEAKGDAASCEAIREAIYSEVDKSLMDVSQPGILSVIPHEGSIDRLKKLYDYHAELRTNAEFEIERHIRQCREKIQELEAKRSGEQDSDVIPDSAER